MYLKIKRFWDRLQVLLDVRGDCIMLFLSLIFGVRVIGVMQGFPPLTASEAAFYASAIGAFAYSNKGE